MDSVKRPTIHPPAAPWVARSRHANGPHTMMASHIHKNDKATTNNDANPVGIAYTYSLSKRTNLYTPYVKIDSKNSLVYTTKVGDGSGGTEFNAGIRHKF